MIKNLKICLLLHFYQPWWQFPHILEKITNECYRPILELINRTPGFCFSANINYSLLELLDKNFNDIVSGFKEAIGKNKLEFLGSTAYHPILPLVPCGQLKLIHILADTFLKREHCDIAKNCDGIFLPEMAFSQDIIQILRYCGYKWTIIDDEQFRFQYGYVPSDHIIAIGGFKTFLRSRYWSNRISFEKIDFYKIREMLNYEMSRWTNNRPAYLILAMDAETFGHHCPGLTEKFLEPMLKELGSEGENILTPLEKLENNFPIKNIEGICGGSWSTSKDDLRDSDPYPLWKSKFNPYHQDLWRLVDIACSYFEKQEISLDLLKITSSCFWWWISGRPIWNPGFMKIGAEKAMEIVRKIGSGEEIKEAEEIFARLKSLK